MVFVNSMTQQSTVLHVGKIESFITLLHRGCMFFEAGHNNLLDS